VAFSPQKPLFTSNLRHYLFLASYLADSPNLATAIRAQAEGYRNNDAPRLLQLYNQVVSPAK
jgi:hypothetical protein